MAKFALVMPPIVLLVGMVAMTRGSSILAQPAKLQFEVASVRPSDPVPPRTSSVVRERTIPKTFDTSVCDSSS